MCFSYVITKIDNNQYGHVQVLLLCGMARSGAEWGEAVRNGIVADMRPATMYAAHLVVGA